MHRLIVLPYTVQTFFRQTLESGRNSMYVCYQTASPSFFWRIFIFTYLAVIQLLGIVLSFQTRKVKHTGLRDSKYVTIIIYFSSIVIVVLALVTFSLRTQIHVGNGIFVTGYFFLTTVMLALIFIPKVCKK